MRKVIGIILPILCITLSSVTNAEFNSHDKDKATTLFNKMKSLVGVWHKAGEKNPKLNISFELTANETVLVETWIHKGKKHSLTIYHQDGDSLIATHYCPQGNQPRLRLTTMSDLNNIAFEFLDATNLASLKDSHQHSLGFEFGKTSQKIKRNESYLSKVGEEFSELVLVRR